MRKRFQLCEQTIKAFKSSTIAFTFIVVVSTGSSFAFSFHSKYQDNPYAKNESVAYMPALQYQPSSAMTDSCLPLLKTTHKIPSQSVTVRNQRSAGKAAAPIVAVGLLFGVRYALTPPGNPFALKVNANANQGSSYILRNGKQSAFAVCDYYHCQKQQALRIINNTN